ncbi:MAG: ABC transporter substrate-binding protein [Deltaproteobacteria bacterium]|nr:ABC transporter substrate-binding protein [Deltaproteobacteria bacterium]
MHSTLIASAAALAFSLTAHAARSTDSGQRLYRTGLLSTGAPVRATVEGDVAVTGRQLSCATCHGQSGMGSIEGRKVVPPIAAPFLSTARPLRSRARPPYTDAALIRAIERGVDPAGNTLDPLMPRYQLPKADAEALVGYLRQLSAKPSEGVEGKTIHLATVITPGTRASERAAMLKVLETFFRQKTANAVDHRSRQITSWPEFYGDWALHVWELHGPPNSWRRQLEAQYRAQPVFALVSGLGGDSWQPVDDFCQARQLPCLMPNVDTPPALGDGGTARYLSGGTAVEAAAIASRLARDGTGSVLQVVGKDAASERGADALADALTRRGTDVRLTTTRVTDGEAIARRARELGADALVIWLDADELGPLGSGVSVPTYFSATLLRGDLALARALAPTTGIVAQPFEPASSAEVRFRRVGSWLASGAIPSTPDVRRIQDQTFFALTVLSEGFMHMKHNLLRDYLLEGVDHFSGLENFSAYYPHLTFGPGQALLSKGCYLVSLRDENHPEWIVP